MRWIIDPTLNCPAILVWGLGIVRLAFRWSTARGGGHLAKSEFVFQ
jgi:hypothetical protein